MSKEELNRLKAVNRQQLELIQKQEARHKADLDKKSRLAWRAQQEKLEKLKGAERTIDAKEKEIRFLSEQLTAKESECSYLQNEVRSLRNAELSPSSSMDDISQVGLSKRERDQAMRNSELSYRIRVLEGDITKLKIIRQSLEQKLSTARQEVTAAREELNPLKEHNHKLQSHISDLNSALRSRENKMNQLSKQLRELKSSHQLLQEDYDKQERKLHQKNNQMLKYESQLHRLKSRNQKLNDEFNQVQDQLRELEDARLQERMYFTSSLQSPTPTISDDEHLSVSSSSLKEQLDQLEFDKDEITANYSELEAKYEHLQSKYADLKNEYKTAREKHKALQNLYELSQQKLKEDNSNEMKKNAARDILLLEREIHLLRSAREDGSFDEDREKLTVLAMQTQLNEYQEKISNLENFIINEDKSMMWLETQWREEFSRLSLSLFNLPTARHDQQVNAISNSNECSLHSLSSELCDADSIDYTQPRIGEKSGDLPITSVDPVDTPGLGDTPSSHQQQLSYSNNADNGIEDWPQGGMDSVTPSHTSHPDLQVEEDSCSEQATTTEREFNQESFKLMEKELHGKNLSLQEDASTIARLTQQVTDLQQQLIHWSQRTTIVHATTQTDQLQNDNMNVGTESYEEIIGGQLSFEDKSSIKDYKDQEIMVDIKTTPSLHHDGHPSDKDFTYHEVQVDMLEKDVTSQEVQVNMEAIPSLRHDGYSSDYASQEVQVDMKAAPSLRHDGYSSDYTSQEVQVDVEATPSVCHDDYSSDYTSREVQVDMKVAPSLRHDGYSSDYTSQEVQVDMEAMPSLRHDGYSSDYTSREVQVDMKAAPSLRHISDYTSQEVQVNMEATPSVRHDDYSSDYTSQEVQVDMEATPSVYHDGYSSDYTSQEVQVDMKAAPSLCHDGYSSDYTSQEVQVNIGPTLLLHHDSCLDAKKSVEVQVDMNDMFSLHHSVPPGGHTSLYPNGNTSITEVCSQEVQVDTETLPSLHLDGYSGDKTFISQESQFDVEADSLHQKRKMFHSQEVQVDMPIVSTLDNEHLTKKKLDSKEVQTVQSGDVEVILKPIKTSSSCQVEQGETDGDVSDALQIKNEELERKFVALKERLKCAETNNLRNDGEITEKNKTIQQLQMEVHKLQTEKTHLEKLCQSRVQDLKARELKMQSLLEEKKRKIESLESMIYKLQTHLAQLKEELKHTESQQYKEQDLLKKEMKRAKSEFKKAKMEIQSFEKELQAIRRQEREKDLVIEEKTKSLQQLEIELGNIILQNDSQAANDVCQSLFDVDEAQNLAQGINTLFNKLDRSVQSGDDNVKSAIEDLRKTIKKLLQIFPHGRLPLNGEEVAGIEKSNQFQTRDETSQLLRLFVVVMDYDPQSLCITGHPELELYLLSGTIVVVLGEMDDQGYYTARHCNREGLVPANFVQEIEVKDRDQMLSRAEEFNEVLLTPCSTPWMDSRRCDEVNPINDSYGKVAVAESSSPNFSSVRETAMASTDSELGDIKTGVSCQEYQLYLAVCDYNPLTSSSSTHPEYELQFKEGDLIKIFGEMMPDKYFIGELNGKRGFVPATFIVPVSAIKSTSPCLSTSKKMTALYDYYPEKHSPNPNPEMELCFHAGDTIIIYGTMHDDGFYTGHIKENIGLVPSNFIKESN